MRIIVWQFFCILLAASCSSGCPDGSWFNVGEKCYKLYTFYVNYNEARFLCKSQEAKLLSVGSNDAMKVLMKTMAESKVYQFHKILHTRSEFLVWLSPGMQRSFVNEEMDENQFGQSRRCPLRYKSEPCTVMNFLSSTDSMACNYNCRAETIHVVCEKYIDLPDFNDYIGYFNPQLDRQQYNSYPLPGTYYGAYRPDGLIANNEFYKPLQYPFNPPVQFYPNFNPPNWDFNRKFHFNPDRGQRFNEYIHFGSLSESLSLLVIIVSVAVIAILSFKENIRNSFARIKNRWIRKAKVHRKENKLLLDNEETDDEI